MSAERRKVKSDSLTPGMTIHEVTGFSSEYAYLDRTLIAFLQERFAGASCAITRGGNSLSVAPDALTALDAVKSVTDIPPQAGLQALDAATIEALRKRGLREFLVTGGSDPAAESAAAQAPAAVHGNAAPQGAPAAVHRNATRQRERVDTARAFVERVGQGAEQRESTTGLVQDLFSQGRAGKYSTQPARQAVEEILSQGLSGAMVAVAGLKSSDQTYAHCVDMSVIFQESYADILRHQGRPVSEAAVKSTLLAGFSHDIGKSTVPIEILESTARFERDSREMQLMRSHAAAGAKILSDLGMDADTVNVAHYHHVKTDPTHPASYPEAVAWDDVRPITRLAAVVDVYQALIGKRSYKKSWVPGKAVEYLQGLRGKEFDPLMLDNFLRVIGRYPVGSLLRLSTGDLAFVVAIGGETPERPVVAVVENAQGERLRQHSLIDLMDTPELSVQEVVDHYEHYSESDDQAFQIFCALNVT